LTKLATIYDKIALQLVPPGGAGSITRLRMQIAVTLEKEIAAALAKQQEERFPELSEMRQKQDERHKELTKYHEELTTAERDMKRKHREKEDELEKREAKIKQKEDRLVALCAAFDAYMAWMDGNGEVGCGIIAQNALNTNATAPTRSSLIRFAIAAVLRGRAAATCRCDVAVKCKRT
jgi:DNA repair exonuclease SbcCD ATPase subunit